MLKNVISLIAIAGMIAIRYAEIIHQTQSDLYLTLLLGGIAIGVSAEEFIKILDYFRGNKN